MSAKMVSKSGSFIPGGGKIGDDWCRLVGIRVDNLMLATIIGLSSFSISFAWLSSTVN
jgi:hypothetical protein